MTNTKKYLLRIRPIDYYFFGSEQTFGGNDGRTNYLAKTLLLPQQTSILGLLRHYFYDYSDSLKDTERESRIGKHGFNMDDSQTYGYIHSLSPVFIREGEDSFWLPTPYMAKVEDESGKAVLPNEASVAIEKYKNSEVWSCHTEEKRVDGSDDKTEITENSIYVLSNYIEKLHIGKAWMKVDQANKAANKEEAAVKIKENDEFFTTTFRIGINKQDRMKDDSQDDSQDNSQDNSQDSSQDDEGFYKQQLAKLNSNYEFACIVKLTDSDEVKNMVKANKVMPFGGEKYLASVSLEEYSDKPTFDQLCERLPVQFDTNGLIGYHLLSDALVKQNDFMQLCDFAIAETKTFRYIHTPEKVYKTGNFSRFSTYRAHLESLNQNKDTDYLHKSRKYNLIARGSVFFVDKNNVEKVENALDVLAMKNIGYNCYRKI